MELLTNSRMGCARTCLRKHQLRYELRLRPAEDSLALRVGSAFHRAKEFEARGLDVFEAVRGFGLDEYDEETVLRLVTGHQWRWQSDALESIAPEQPFDLPLINPETGAATPTWRIAGKMDGIVRLADGRLALHEYKTTSDDISPGSDYWIRLRLDQQVSLYFIAARASGFDVQTVLYDVTHKPSIRPYKATPAESRKYTKDGKLYANQREADETRAEWGERLNDDIAARPDFYFARVEIPRLESDLEEFRAELWQQQLALRLSQRNGHWFRNTSACVTPGRTCEFMHVCHRTDLDQTTPEGFVRVDDVHPELSSLEASPATTAR